MILGILYYIMSNDNGITHKCYIILYDINVIYL